MSPEPPLDATGIARRQFSTVRKGYDPAEVRAYLRELADMVGRLQREEAHEHERADRAESRALLAEQLDEHRLVELLGEETARVLDAARKAAGEIRTKAEQSAARLVREAQVDARGVIEQADKDAAARRVEILAEADALRRLAEDEVERRRAEAQVVVDDMRREAEHEREHLLAEGERARSEAEAGAEQIRASAREQGRRLVGEAQAVRERILTDLSRRRRVAREQLERLNGARERLLAAYEVVRRTVDEATAELSVALPQARAASELAMRRVSDEPEETVEVLEAELAVARMAGLVDEMAATAVSDDELDALLSELADEEATLAARAAEADGTPGGTAGGETASPAADAVAAGRGADVTGEIVPGAEGAATEDRGAAATGPEDAGVAGVDVAAGAGSEVGGDAAAGNAGVAEAGASAAGDDLPRVAAQEGGTGASSDGQPAERAVSAVSGRGATARAAPGAGHLTRSGTESGRPSPRIQTDAERWGVRLPRSRRATVHPVEPAADGTPVGPPPTDPTLDPGALGRPGTGTGTRTGTGAEGEGEDEGETGPYVDELFARIRSERELGTGADRPTDDAGGPEGVDRREVAAAVRADADTASPRGEADDTEPTDAATRIFRQRDEALGAAERDLGRKLKRVLADEQNEVLDRLRRGGPVEFADVVPAADEHADRFAIAALPALDDAASHGAALVGGKPESCDDLAGTLGRSLVEPLRSRIERSFDDCDGDLDEVSERLRALYREWKANHIGVAVRHYTASAYARGAYAAARRGGPLRWLVDTSCDSCPDCDDNALAGQVPRGDAFPTGDVAAPAHPNCRCLVVPAHMLDDG